MKRESGETSDQQEEEEEEEELFVFNDTIEGEWRQVTNLDQRKFRV